MPYNICYKIREDSEFSIKSGNGIVNLKVDSFSLIIDKKPEEILEMVIRNNEIIKYINFSDNIIKMMVDNIINNRDDKKIVETLSNEKIPLFSMFINIFNKCKTEYLCLREIGNAKKIIFECNKENLLSAFSVACNFNIPIVIDIKNITLDDYRTILSSFDFEKIKGLNIKVDYQEKYYFVDPKELYDTSLIICDIANEVKKYNLSPLEQIMYVYDIVKYRIYKENENDKRASRDLNRILQGDDIVCVGYSRLFNTILQCLGINALSLIDYEKKHQRSLVYIKDSKYDIDCVYSFDPTGDRRRSESSEYIDNYYYFAIPINLDDKEIFGEELKTVSMSFNDIFDKIENNYDFKIINNLETLFKLTNNNDFEKFIEQIIFCSYSNKNKDLIDFYTKFLSKYANGKNDIVDFVKALYNVRRIQFYNGKVDKLDIDDIIYYSVQRYVFLEGNRLKKEKIEAVKRFVTIIAYEEKLSELLEETAVKNIESSLNDGITIPRDNENIKLLKVLKKRLDEKSNN